MGCMFGILLQGWPSWETLSLNQIQPKLIAFQCATENSLLSIDLIGICVLKIKRQNVLRPDQRSMLIFPGAECHQRAFNHLI